MSVQLLSCVWLFVTPWTAACLASMSITKSRSLLKPHVHRVTDAIQLSHPLSSPSPPTFSLSQHQGLFQWLVLFKWPKYWSLTFSISPSNEYSGLISISMDWLDLLAVQGTLKSLLQHHNSKASVIWCLAFFIGQLSCPYMTRCHDISFLNVEFQTNFFTLCFRFHQEALQLIFAFCHKGSVICISVVIDISPSNFESSLCFIQSSISHDVHCI